MTDRVEPLVIDEEVDAVQVRPACPRFFWPLRSLWYRDYFFYWTGMLLSYTGSWVQTFAMSWMVYEMTGRGLYLGLVAAANTLPSVFLSLPAGVLADRFSKRNIAVITQSLAMLQAAILAVLAYAHCIQIWHVVVLAMFAGVINAFDVPTRQSMVAELVRREDLLNGVALGSLAFNGSRIVGPLIGGLIYHICKPAGCFTINSISFLAAIAGLLMIRPRKLARAARDTRMLDQIYEGLRYIRSNVLIRDMLIMTGMVSVFAMQYSTIMPIWAKKVLGSNEFGQGVLMASAGAGAALAAIVVASIGHRFPQGKVVLTGAFLLSASLLIFSQTNSLTVSAGALVLVGFGMMLFISVSNTIIQSVPPDIMRGRVMGVRTLVFIGGAPALGSLLCGYLVDHIHTRPTVVVYSLICLMMALFFSIRSKATREAP